MTEHEDVYVEAVNLEKRLALMSDGEVLPIIKLINIEGKECDDPEDAFGAVAGPDANGKWAAIMLQEFNFNRVVH